MMSPIRFRRVALALIVFGLGAFGDFPEAQTVELKTLMQEKFQLAEIFEVAEYASEKCPGLHVIEDGVSAAAKAAGVTDDDIYSPEWKIWESRGQMNARIGYEKDPSAFCERTWRFLGPDHPPYAPHQRLKALR